MMVDFQWPCVSSNMQFPILPCLSPLEPHFNRMINLFFVVFTVHCCQLCSLYAYMVLNGCVCSLKMTKLRQWWANQKQLGIPILIMVILQRDKKYVHFLSGSKPLKWSFRFAQLKHDRVLPLSDLTLVWIVFTALFEDSCLFWCKPSELLSFGWIFWQKISSINYLFGKRVP